MTKSKVRKALDLIKDSAQGDEEALVSLFSLYWPRVHHAVRLRLGVDLRRLYNSRDIPFQALSRAIRSFPLIQWQGEGSFLGWLYYITLGLVRSEISSKEKNKESAKPEGESSGKNGRTSRWQLTFSYPQQEKDLELIRAALQEIPNELETLLDLRLFLKMSLVELGEYFGITPEDSSKRLRKAVAAFAEAFVEPAKEKRDVTRRFCFQESLKSVEEGKVFEPESHFNAYGPEKEMLCKMWKAWQRAEKAAGWKEAI